MNLIPNNIQIPSIGETEMLRDPIVLIKLFHPSTSWSWFITEYSKDGDLCFGLVDGHEQELGYFSLKELRQIIICGVRIERDLHFLPVPLSKLRESLKEGM